MTIAMPSTAYIMNSPESEDVELNETPYGDGYERVSPSGINHIRRTFSITWVPMETADAHTLRDALSATNYTETITWTPEGEATALNLRLVKGSLSCQWVLDGTNKQVSARFKEIFI